MTIMADPISKSYFKELIWQQGMVWEVPFCGFNDQYKER